MDLLFGIVAIAGLFLFLRQGMQESRLRATLERLDLAEADIRHLRFALDEVLARRSVRRRPTASAADFAPLADSASAAFAAHAVSTSMGPAAASPGVDRDLVRSAATTATASAIDSDAGDLQGEDEPAGPGMLSRAFAALGLAVPEGETGVSRATIQTWLEGRLLAVVGGIALVLGAVFFLSLAFSRGWITEPLRVLLGLGAGTGLLVLGELALTRMRGIVGHVLVAVGLSITSLALLAASRLYGLVPAEWALAGSLVAAIAAAVIALRHRSQVIAGFGLVTILAAPPVMGADASVLTLAFVGAALLGTTAIALYRTWSWLPPLAFLLVAPQLAAYLLGGAPGLERLAVVAAFWLVNVVAAGGEEARRPSERLRRTTVTLLLTNAAYAVWAGLAILDGELAGLRGGFLALLGLAHLALGLAFLYRLGDRQPFGLVVAATGVAALTMAVPIQLEGAAVAVVWAAQAVVLAWVAWARRHPQTAWASAVLGGLALAHLLLFEYPFTALYVAFEAPPSIPFAGSAGITAGFLAVALLAAGWIVQWSWLRASLAGVGGVVAAYVAAFELGGPALVWAWSAIAVAAVLADGRFAGRALAAELERERDRSRGAAERFFLELAPLALPTAAGLALFGAIAHLLTIDFPFLRLGQILSDPPFAGWESLALAPVALGLAAVARLDPRHEVQVGAAGLGLIIMVYAVTFELPRPAVMVAWAALGIAGLVIARRFAPVPPRGDGAMTVPGLAIRMPVIAAAVAALFLLVQAQWYAPVGDWPSVTIGWADNPAVPFLDDRTLAFAILALACLVAGDAMRSPGSRLAGAAAAAAAVAWLLPYELPPSPTVAGWCALALAGSAVLARAPVAGDRRLLKAGIATLAVLSAVVGLTAAPPSLLWVWEAVPIFGSRVLADAVLAAGSIGLLLLGSGLVRAPSIVRTRLLVAAAGVGLYVASIALVDTFQAQVDRRPVEELAKEAQVALSVLWSVVGGAAFAAGIRLRRPTTRLFGLAVLGLATAKVFAFDLSSLDVAYRVLSLLALGVLLLASAWVYARLQHDTPVADQRVADEGVRVA